VAGALIERSDNSVRVCVQLCIVHPATFLSDQSKISVRLGSEIVAQPNGCVLLVAVQIPKMLDSCGGFRPLFQTYGLDPYFRPLQTPVPAMNPTLNSDCLTSVIGVVCSDSPRA
jgi:hypothetical protein